MRDKAHHIDIHAIPGIASRWLLVFIALVAVAAAPALADPPIGSLGGKVGSGNGGGGVLGLHGWAIDDDGVAAVDIFVDGVIVGRANYGFSRPGVAQRYSSAVYPDADRAGFGYPLDTTRFLNGLHTVEARVTSITGEQVFLNPVVLEFTNTTHTLAPFGEIEFPNKSAELFGTCNLVDERRRLAVVSGWALDVGIETGDMGVGYVELLIDGALYANSRTDCAFNRDTGGLSNCYGLRRLDIERRFPQLEDSPLSGFRFVLDIGLLIDQLGFTEGRHVLTARVGDISGQVANVSEIPVDFFCDDRIGNEVGLGWIGPVQPQTQITDVADFRGWALDWEGVDRVEIYIDGEMVGIADYGNPSPRLNQLYPGYPDSTAGNWNFRYDTRQLANGRHDVQAIVFDLEGRSTLLGERDFVVVNPEN